MGSAPVTSEGAFRRARRPEQKQQRYEAILDAAHALALRDGVAAVTLTAIAAEVGMHKSALLKYFGTREEIFLRLAESDWSAWADGLVADLGRGPVDEQQLVEVLTRSLVERPLICQMLTTHSALTFEREVPIEAARRSKSAAMQAAGEVADAVHAAFPALDPGASRELVIATGLMAASLWQVAHPAPVVAATFDRSPEERGFPQAAPIHFAEALARFIHIHLAGLRHV
ncbi:MAG TPA: TetR family transcriptional regulator [Actinomycetospora sp.]|uniref:TetR family transcriptional regulator n=1 Tax=Actinomycetospora sp. TaxID=1872135 RepID=UPI002F407F55